MYIEGLGSASIANGVLRIETFVRSARGEDVPGADLLIPVTRLPAVSDFLKNIVDQLRQQEAQAPAEETPSIERMVY